MLNMPLWSLTYEKVIGWGLNLGGKIEVGVKVEALVVVGVEEHDDLAVVDQGFG